MLSKGSTARSPRKDVERKGSRGNHRSQGGSSENRGNFTFYNQESETGSSGVDVLRKFIDEDQLLIPELAQLYPEKALTLQKVDEIKTVFKHFAYPRPRSKFIRSRSRGKRDTGDQVKFENEVIK